MGFFDKLFGGGSKESTPHQTSEVPVCSVANGQIINLDEIPDETFAERMVGDGVAVRTSETQIYSPVNGTITSIAKELHAFMLTDDNGLEYLVHIGIDTVNLKGEPFKALVKEGDKVTTNSPVIEVDWSKVTGRVPSNDIMVLCTSEEKMKGVHVSSDKTAKRGVQAFTVTIDGVAKNTASPAASTPASSGNGKFQFSKEIVVLDKIGLHARPAAKIVKIVKDSGSPVTIIKEGKEAPANSIGSIMQLNVRFQDKITIGVNAANGNDIIAKIEDAINSEANNAPEPTAKKENKLTGFKGSANAKPGIAASAGVGYGKVFLLKDASESREYRAFTSVDDEKTLFKKAVKDISEELEHKKLSAASKSQREVFEAHSLLITDDQLKQTVYKYILQNNSADKSVDLAVKEIGDELIKSGNEYMAQRKADYVDLSNEIYEKITGKSDDQMKHLPEGEFVLASRELLPSQTAQLPMKRIQAIISAEGGATSHASILSQSLGIPSVVGLGDIVYTLNGKNVAVNGVDGFIEIEPTGETLELVNKTIAKIHEAKQTNLKNAKEPAITTDGVKFKCLGNAATADDVAKAVENGAEGIGLLRSEILLESATTRPTAEEQAQILVNAEKHLQGRPIKFRLFDIGADKQVSFLKMEQEGNPFLGIRGIRLLLKEQELMREQIKGVYLAVKETKMNAQIMIPMISTVTELKQSVKIIEEVRQSIDAPKIPIGIMLEVPSAIFMIEKLSEYAEFFSIGTNDLTQYMLAADRQNPNLGSLADDFDPGVLQAIALAAKLCNKTGRTLGVCGKLASKMEGALFLVGIGVNEISSSVSSIPDMKAAIREHSMTELQALAQKAITMPDPASARALYL